MTDLVAFFETAELPPDPVKLNAWTTILNCKLCVEADLIGFEATMGRPRLHAQVIRRLEELRTYILNRTADERQ